MRRLYLTFAVLLGALTACSASSSPAPTATPRPTSTATSLQTVPKGNGFTATLITDVNGLHDRSFNALAWRGLKAAKKRYGLSINAVESRSASAYLPNLVRAAQHYSTLTIAIGYGMARAVYTAAHQFPLARFAVVDGRPLDENNKEVNLRNVENLLFKEQDAGYAVGVIAGLMEKDRVGKATHNTIGYLGGQPIPAVDHYLAGYVAGAKKVDPAIKIIGDYAHSFADPKGGQAIGNRQIAAGADILFQVAADSGRGYLDAARSHGVYGIGVDSNQRFLGPEVITSAVKRVNVAVRIAVHDTFTGHFHPGDLLLGASSGSTGFAHPAPVVPAAVVSQARSYAKQIASGTIVPSTTIPNH